MTRGQLVRWTDGCDGTLSVAYNKKCYDYTHVPNQGSLSTVLIENTVLIDQFQDIYLKTNRYSWFFLAF